MHRAVYRLQGRLRPVSRLAPFVAGDQRLAGMRARRSGRTRTFFKAIEDSDLVAARQTPAETRRARCHRNFGDIVRRGHRRFVRPVLSRLLWPSKRVAATGRSSTAGCALMIFLRLGNEEVMLHKVVFRRCADERPGSCCAKVKPTVLTASSGRFIIGGVGSIPIFSCCPLTDRGAHRSRIEPYRT